jgi:selenocysteine-specific elongation factor
VTKDSIARGDVLVASGHYETTQTIDVALKTVKQLSYVVKQRGAIKLHIGTAEVYGKIVFFDRNELLEDGEDVLCQLRLEHPVVTRRGDRFILRRPTPTETIGGGHVIDAHGKRYRFGQETMEMLARKKEGTPEELIVSALVEKKILSFKELSQETGLQLESIREIIETQDSKLTMLPSGEVTVVTVTHSLRESLTQELQQYHQEHPLREGMKKAELIQIYTQTFPKRLTEWLLQSETETFQMHGPLVSHIQHVAHPPKQWKKRVEQVVHALKEEGLKVSTLEEHFQAQQLPETLYTDLVHYLTREELIIQIDDKLYFHREPFTDAVKKLYNDTSDEFLLQDAKESTDLTRKYLVPFLEKLDQIGLTVRVENVRKWREERVEQWLKK